MDDAEAELRQLYLYPGEAHLARVPTLLRTILGSCVGVTFWHARLGLGALCHGVLPACPPGARAPEGYRYVDFAIRELVRQMAAEGARGAELQVKVFGGADVLPVAAASVRQTVGRQNWQCALEVLRAENLAVTTSDLGGIVGRTIQFHTGTGEVLLRRLAQLNSEAGSEIPLMREY